MYDSFLIPYCFKLDLSGLIRFVSGAAGRNIFVRGISFDAIVQCIQINNASWI